MWFFTITYQIKRKFFYIIKNTLVLLKFLHLKEIYLLLFKNLVLIFPCLIYAITYQPNISYSNEVPPAKHIQGGQNVRIVQIFCNPKIVRNVRIVRIFFFKLYGLYGFFFLFSLISANFFI